MDWGCGVGKMTNFYNFDVKGVSDVVSDEFEARICKVPLKVDFFPVNRESATMTV